MALALDSETRKTVLPEYTHIAFTVSEDYFKQMSRKIVSSGAEIWQSNESEGPSLYFTDPNGHKPEIHASDLTARIRRARDNPWDGLHIYDGEEHLT